jgi:orotidine-5'-phosphate decarboxylase
VKRIVGLDKSIIPACDVETLEDFKKLVEKTCGVEGIGGYKIGLALALAYGLPKLVETAAKLTDLPLIYDHQKAATDIPDMGEVFAKTCKTSGIGAVILFPQAGPATEEEWIRAAQKAGLGVIVGGEMTHPEYLDSDGGFIVNEAPSIIYRRAVELGVTDFVVPGNKPAKVRKYRQLIEEANPGVKAAFYAPGFVAQGGVISDAAKAAGERFHAIVGRGIYAASDMTTAAKEHAKAILG